ERHSTTAARLQRVLILSGLVCFVVAIWDLTMGGFYVRVFGVRISSWEVHKPFRNAMLCGAAALWLRDRAAGDRASWFALADIAPWIAALTAIGSAALAVGYGIFAAGGSDAFGYVSQAALWTTGGPIAHDPFALLAPTLGAAVAPLGYEIGRA